MEEISLHATDKIQRDIEEALHASGMFYERRKNHYLNLGAHPLDMITPMYLASGVLALIHREPWSAVSLKQKHLRQRWFYDHIFSEHLPLSVWTVVAKILKASDSILEGSRPNNSSEGFLKKNRYILALLVLSRSLGTFDYSLSKLSQLKIDDKFMELARETWDLIPHRPNGSWRSRSAASDLCTQLARSCGIDGVKRVLSAGPAASTLNLLRKKNRNAVSLTGAFIDSAYRALPPQPWKPGIHKTVCATLGCTQGQLAAAVELLVKTGRLLRQQDGVLYGPDGSIRGYDAERVRISQDGSIVRLAD